MQELVGDAASLTGRCLEIFELRPRAQGWPLALSTAPSWPAIYTRLAEVEFPIRELPGAQAGVQALIDRTAGG